VLQIIDRISPQLVPAQHGLPPSILQTSRTTVEFLSPLFSCMYYQLSSCSYKSEVDNESTKMEGEN